MTILLTGGAGYIGSITNAYLQSQGFSTVIFDNSSTGHTAAIGSTPLISGDIRKPRDIEKVFLKFDIDMVIHFAALALAGESMQKPAEYYETNVMGGVHLLEMMRQHHCQHIIFSSSCSVFGYPTTLPVTETSPKDPLSVYAETKYTFEKILTRYDERFGIKHAILRYFNASGATLDGSLGEDHMPETHLIPSLLLNALGQRSTFDLYGTDYQTPDGSCIRDYIHVEDLARAHVKAMEYITKTNTSNDFNLGSGKGYSNKEIIAATEKITGKEIPVTIHPRRPGDPDAVYADPKKASSLLSWKAEYSDLETIIKTAWTWHSSHPHGFNTVRVGSS